MKKYMTQKQIELMKKIKEDDSELKIWQILENGCAIATMGYSEKNILIIKKLLKSFAEQYHEIIDYKSAKEELKYVTDNGKVFLYIDENGNIISMNECVYNYENETVEFCNSNSKPKNLYIYGLSTEKKNRGKGACTALVNYAICYALANDFDLIYARTDLNGSNSEKIMQKAGMEICEYEDKIIAEWVDVSETKGDYRLHMWLPFKEGLNALPKKSALFAGKGKERIIQKQHKTKILKKI